ncbi:MAG: secretin N-terminal domain-containing protein [Planctomycetaceae bacterium]
MKLPHDNVKRLVANYATREFALNTSRQHILTHCREIITAIVVCGLLTIQAMVCADEFKPAVAVTSSEVVIESPTSPSPQPPAPVTPQTDGATPMPMPGQPAPGTEAKPGDASANGSVKRPTSDKYVPQHIDNEIRKNPEGKVSFNIKGQPWEPVLQWLADASALSLDWQELPGDSLNLITTREYTMEEARDLINRHLLSRGFTMIVTGEVMSIVKTKELNPAMVQRVTPEMLAKLPDHTMCKVSFDLDWLVADEAVEELKPMLSSAGQIHKLSRTNRLEVIDTAISLRQLWELIESEQSKDGEEQLVRAFHLQNRRADDVIKMLRELLKLQGPGGDAAAGGGGGMDPNMMMQMMQQMQQQMQQAAAQAGAAGGAAGAKAKVETRLVLNQKENMILAQAAPDQMAIIEKAIEQIDVVSGREGSLLDNINRMKIYRLESIDPQTLADLLQQLGDLDPATVLKVDKQKRSIIAWATLADHLTITSLVEKLDQSSRKIEVIPLRRLDAEYVAGTIRLLMGKEEEKEENPMSRRYGFFDFGMMNNQDSVKEPSFKVEADTENNRLLVNANNIEMDEIQDLLIKLGELPDPNAANDGVRVFDLNPDEDLNEFRERLQRYWRRGNNLEFDLPPQDPKDDNPSDESGEESGSEKRMLRDGDDDKAEPQRTGKDKRPINTSTTAVDSQSRPDSSRVRVWHRGNTSVSAESPLTPQMNSRPGAELDRLLEAHRAAQQKTTVDESAFFTGLRDEETSSPARDDAGSQTSLEDTVPAKEEQKESADDTAPEKKSEPRISRELIDKLRKQLDAAPKVDAEPESEMPAEESGSAPVIEEGSPVKISVTPDGKLIVSSKDPQALAEMEELISQVAAPRRSFKVYRLQYATPSWVTLNLKDFFKADEETKSTLEYSPYWGIMPSEKKVKGNRTLSKRRQPQFISDNFTSTILVRDADVKQLQTIEDLIKIYDVPEPSDSRSMRVTTIFRLEHAKATSVAAAVKDVFRDLLSSNDKALEKDDKNGQRQGSGGLVTFLPGGEKKEGEDEEEPIRFKGLLSIGIDESSNTLIVSSAGTLMDTISEMIESLDRAADSSSVVQVIKVDKSVDLSLIQERLKELMKSAQPQPGQQPGQPGVPMPGQPMPGQPGIPGAEAAVQEAN